MYHDTSDITSHRILRLPNTQQIPQPEIAYAVWRGDVLLKREPNTQVFSLYQDMRGCDLEALFKTLKDSPRAMDCLRSVRRKAWEEYLDEDHKQSIRIPRSVTRIGKWTPRRVLAKKYQQFDCIGRAISKLALTIKIVLFQVDILMPPDEHLTARLDDSQMDPIVTRDDFTTSIVPLIGAHRRADKGDGR